MLLIAAFVVFTEILGLDLALGALAENGVANGLMKTSEAVPLVGGAMLTVILFPVIAMRLTGIKRQRGGYDDRDGL